jgi:hypothetical protein
MLMVRKKSRFREEEDCGRKKGRRFKKRYKIKELGRK